MKKYIDSPYIQKMIERNKHHQKQVSGNSAVLLKRGKITLELHLDSNNLVLCDGWLTNWVTLYDKYRWASDDGWFTTETIKKRLYRLCWALGNEGFF